MPADRTGNITEPSFNYAIVIGTLQYFQGHIRPNISFAVSKCSRYIQHHTYMHVTASKRIGRYLPTLELTIDCDVDADFSGLWNREDHNDKNCFKSRTGFVLCTIKCPVLWITRLQE